MIKGATLSLSLQDVSSALIAFKIDTACPLLSLVTDLGQLSLGSNYLEGWRFHFTLAFCPTRPDVSSLSHCILSDEREKCIY